jgi:hypothetical protein
MNLGGMMADDFKLRTATPESIAARNKAAIETVKARGYTQDAAEQIVKNEGADKILAIAGADDAPAAKGDIGDIGEHGDVGDLGTNHPEGVPKT